MAVQLFSTPPPSEFAYTVGDLMAGVLMALEADYRDDFESGMSIVEEMFCS